MMRTTQSILIVMLTTICLATRVRANDTAIGPVQATNEPQVTLPPQGGVNWKGVGIAAGTVASNLVYVPAKLVYGILGGIEGGAGYALTGGNKQVANTIWENSLGGDYVLTPQKLTGQEPIYFSGPSGTGSSHNSITENSQTPPISVASPPASLSTSQAVPSGSLTTLPIDTGTRPVDAAATPQPNPYAAVNNSGFGYSHSSYAYPKTLKRSRLPDTSIE